MRGEREQGERVRGEREQGERVRGEREQGERVRGEREQGEREEGERVRGENSTTYTAHIQHYVYEVQCSAVRIIRTTCMCTCIYVHFQQNCSHGVYR